MKATALFLTIIITAVVTTGCWDNLDLERRALVLGTAVDLLSVENGSQQNEQIELTLEMPILRRMAARSSGGGGGSGGGGDEKELPTWQLTLTGLTVDEAISNAATRSERRIFLGHQKVIIIGEELARRHNLMEVLDFWPRNREGYLAITVLLTDGRAGDLFTAQPKFARSVSMFLQEQAERQLRTSRFIKHNLSDLIATVNAGRDILIARAALVKGKDAPELQVSGTGVIKEGKLVGWLNPAETQAAVWVSGEFKGGEILALPIPELARILSLKLNKIKADVHPQFTGDGVSMAIKLDINADITETMGNRSPLGAKDLPLIESQAGEEIKQRVQQVVGRLQREYQADVLGFGHKIEQSNPRLWENIKNNWRQIFMQMPVSVDVKIKIRHTGMVS
ncbi:Ger(x)C family spore germination protein [Neomoorella thermoacetica]|uniref:Ger(x)C family spore germination protein n=1 Tax=Neomoorella thermoacetica TaxID=1525 RepID=UPI0030CDED74